MWAQQKFFVNTDTVAIGDVRIISRVVSGSAGYRVTKIPDGILKDYRGSSLSELLEENSILVIKNYGNGGLATSSFRGMGASHTKVLWAGIPVNPPASGQVDFSILPVTLTGAVEIYHGASPLGNGGGGPGGTISFNSVPDWKKGTEMFYRHVAGSFGFNSGDLSIVTGSDSWQLFTNSYRRKAENNFSYLDNVTAQEDVIKTRKNNSYNMMGISQELFLKKGKSIITGRYWLNKSDRELPGPILTAGNKGENQEDKQIWLIAGIRNYSLPVVLDFRGAYMSDYLQYVNTEAGINSLTRGTSIYIFGSGKVRVSEHSDLEISFSERLSGVNSVNHGGKRYKDLGVLRSEYSYTNNRIGILVLAEINYSDRKLYAPLPSVGMDFRLSEKRPIYLKGNLGTSMTIPTLNDLYWIPGGNPNLKNETGINSEVSLEMRSDKRTGVIPGGELTLYNSRLWNMIKWVPGDFGIWTPGNIAEVNSFGAEADARIEFRSLRTTLSLGFKYSLNRAVSLASGSEDDATTGKQLAYVPLHKANADMKLTYSNFSLKWFAGISGLRYTTADNSSYIPGYIINNISAGYSVQLSGFVIGSTFTVNNVFDTDYEQVAYYPMPGRNYMLSLDLNFGKRR